MQHVKLSWLRRLNYSFVGISIVLFLVYGLFEQLGVSQATKDRWGITPLILIFAGVQAIYAVIADRLFFKRIPWLTTIISISMYGFLAASIIESSGNTNIFYRVVLGVLVFVSAMAGMFAPLTATIFVWMLLVFTVTGIATPTNASLTFNIVANTFITVMAVLGWLYFRRYYTPDSDKEKKKLVETIEQEQFKASLILESIGDGVIIIGPDGTVQLINNSASTMLGWKKEECSGISYEHLMTPLQEGNQAGPSPQNPIAATVQTGKTTQKVALFKTKAKDAVYFDILASPIIQEQPAAKNAGVVVVFRDVSAARAEEKAKADFISTASHEMRTPVAAIEGYLALALNDKVSTIDQKAREYLLKAHQNTQHLGELFQDLLTTTKAEDGRLVNNPEVVEMSSFVEQLSNDLRFVAEKKGLQVQFVVGEQAHTEKMVKPLYYCLVDPTRIQEVITNLFDNAVKYTETGSITIGITGDQSVVQCSIQDTGHGIPAEDIKHLFQKFYRVDSSVTRTIGGTGLGLFICRKIVELYGGRIWVESTVGKGSTFYINIPRMTAQQAADYQANHPAQVPTAATPAQPSTPPAPN
jgi:PAS domain S-box-containing protein